MNGHLRRLSLTLFLAICALASSLVFAPVYASAADSELATEIARLTDAVNRLADLQKEKATDNRQDDKLRRLNLAIAYLDYRSKRIESLEREVSSNRTTTERLELFLQQIDHRGTRLEEEARNNPQMSKQETAQELKSLGDQKKMISARLESLDGKLIQLENEIIELKSQLAPTERYIQTNLDF